MTSKCAQLLHVTTLASPAPKMTETTVSTVGKSLETHLISNRVRMKNKFAVSNAPTAKQQTVILRWSASSATSHAKLALMRVWLVTPSGASTAT